MGAGRQHGAVVGLDGDESFKRYKARRAVSQSEHRYGFGVEVDYVPLADLSGWDAAIKANTKLLFVESPSNPLAELVDIAALSEVAHAKGAMLVVDNWLYVFANSGDLVAYTIK